MALDDDDMTSTEGPADGGASARSVNHRNSCCIRYRLSDPGGTARRVTPCWPSQPATKSAVTVMPLSVVTTG